ncbi:MAG: site-2 protease family protein [Planctomycetota bacterium]
MSVLSLFLSAGPAEAMSTVRGLIGVVLGVGALIFFHELGHFLAAKWACVRVDVFSLGMGPRLFGVVRGGTDYRISLLPIGGYVSMLGQVDGDPDQPRTDAEDDFRNKPVGKRFVIMIAGVLMNLVLAAVGFVLCFGLGVEFTAPEVGRISPGSAAARGDVRPGDVITHVDGAEILSMQDLSTLVAIADGELELTIRRGAETVHTKVTPIRRDNDSYAQIGIAAPEVVREVDEGSPFYAAGLRPATPERDFRWRNVAPVSSRLAPDVAMSMSDILRVLADEPGKVVATFDEVHYDAQGIPTSRAPVQLEVQLEHHPSFHLGLAIEDRAWIRGVTPDSAAARAGVQPGDCLLRLGGEDVSASNLAQTVREAGARVAESGGHVELVLERAGARRTLDVVLVPQNADVLARELAGVTDPAKRLDVRRERGSWLLGVGPYAADVVTAPCSLQTAAGAALTLSPGDRITSVWLTEGTVRWSDKQGFHREMTRRLPAARRFKLAYLPKGASEEQTAVVTTVPDPAHTIPTLGFQLSPRELRIQRSPLSALHLGVEQTLIQTRRIALMLGAFVSGSVSPKELGGPIQIVNVTYRFASQDSLAKLLHLLAILSVNLAVINVLPIPVLDGGHIFFLLVEKLKGKPVSTEVLINAQWFGLFCILGLMALVVFNDIRRML